MIYKGYDWECREHKTFGDNGWSCAVCGYPLGIKNIELNNRQLKILKLTINLFLFRIYIWKELYL